MGGELRCIASKDEAVNRAHQPQRERRRTRVVLVPVQDAEYNVAVDDFLRRMAQQVRVQRRAQALAGIGLEAQAGGELRARLTQNIRPPTGTSRSGRRRITRPSSSGTPSTSTSERTGPIWRGGKFTTATTRLPSRSSRV